MTPHVGQGALDIRENKATMQGILHVAHKLCLIVLLALLSLPLSAQRGQRARQRTARQVVKALAIKPVATPKRRVTPQDSATAYALYLSAVVAREKGQVDAMYELLTRATALDPTLSAAYRLLAEPTRTLYPTEPQRVEGLLQRALDLAPQCKDYIEALALHHMEHEAMDKALPLFQQLVAMGGRTVPYLQHIYTIQARSGRYHEALATLDKLERLDGDSEQVMVQRIKLYTALEQEHQALAIIDSLITANPQDLNYVNYKAAYYLQKGKPQEALRVVEQGLAEDSLHAPLHRSRVAAYHELRDTAHYGHALYDFMSLPTEDYLEKLLSVLRATMQNQDAGLYPLMLRLLSESFERVDRKTDLADLYTSYLTATTKDKEVLREHLRHIVRQVPTHTEARLQLLRELLQDTAIVEATMLCDEGMHYMPDNPVFYYYKGLFQAQDQQRTQALATLKQGQAYLNSPIWHTDLVSDYYGIMGDLYFQLGQSKKAWQALDSALVYNGANATVLNNYAFYLYLERKNLPKALQMSAKATELEATNGYYYDTYIDLLLLHGQYDEAQAVAERALKQVTSKDDGLQYVWEAAGDVAYLRGQKADALHYWQEAQRHGADSPTLLKKIAQKRYFIQSKKEALKP